MKWASLIRLYKSVVEALTKKMNATVKPEENDDSLFTSIIRRNNNNNSNENSKLIHCDNTPVKINWNKVVNLEDEGNLALPNKCYRTIRGRKRFPKTIVIHWDATLSSKQSKKIFVKRGISTHFSIDNDGTIYQMVDPQNIAWHAIPINDISIGIDLSNAYYMKYQRIYKKRYKPRPVLEDSFVHGVKLKPHLGYYSEQIKALKELLKSLNIFYKIPLVCPQYDDGDMIKTVYRNAINKKFNGVVCHYHVNRNKIDCAGLELKKILENGVS